MIGANLELLCLCLFVHVLRHDSGLSSVTGLVLSKIGSFPLRP